MKKKILSLGFIGVSTLFWACADDTSPVAPPPTSYIESSSSVFVGNSSSSAQQQTPTSSSSATAKDPTIKHVVVTEPAPGVNYPDIYNKPVFCFTEGCEKTVTPPSSSSKAQPTSSSNGGGITIDAPENKEPVVNGMTMTDTRDNNTYKLIQVGGKLWMAQDLNYAGATSECFNEQEANCASNGRLYTFNSAQRACPTGWRIPTREEAQAALDDESIPWSYSGRCKDGDCNFLGDMGFHWTSGTPQETDKKFSENGGSNGALIIVEKSPEYMKDKEGEDARFFQVDQKNKRFSIRCVQE
ncbi:FISUMP domain-containing protein [Fibrobacter sp. UBA4297]|uniref:FISUMP domain-containing protein n=1 Tax=Fibrobacter sp. UBA4297 TaxID=1946536 RepID=UPI0025C436C8|nr:FISUMP domain-containing protein [Fibrobacter sp. UBA4297]